MTDLREIGPTYFFAPPRIFENLLTQVMIRMEDAARLKRWLFHYFMGVARRVGAGACSTASRCALRDRLLYAARRPAGLRPAAERARHEPHPRRLHRRRGDRPRPLRFYRSLGINLKQLYGMTETSVFVCIQPDGEVKPDTVGTPITGVEIRDRRQRRGAVPQPGRVPGATTRTRRRTREAMTPDGWVHTGDAGFFDARRAPEDHRPRQGRRDGSHDGALFAPEISSRTSSSSSPTSRRRWPSATAATVRHAPSSTSTWTRSATGPSGAEPRLHRLHRPGGQTPEVLRADPRRCVEEVNAALAAEPQLAASQIRRFLILHKELDADDGELTRTRKVRRGFIAEKYAPLIEALYVAPLGARGDAGPTRTAGPAWCRPISPSSRP